MIPVVTPEEMRAADAAAPEPAATLVARAGSAVARAALDLLGGAYGRRVVVVAGRGNNGADGRVAGERLRRRGVRVLVVDAASAPRRLPASDLVIDAAYGTGFRGEYCAPDPGGAPVLAVDVPSGVDGLTGRAGEEAVTAVRTVTFAALKPGLLLADGRDRAGAVDVVDIGLAVQGRAGLVEDADVHLPARPRHTHKWRTAVAVVAGSPGMMGAPALVARAAMRAGAGYVLLGIPGAGRRDLPTGTEAVSVALPALGWADTVLARAERYRAVVVGPGLGRDEHTLGEVRRLVARSSAPVVVDADAIAAFVGAGRGAAGASPVVFTPHDAEFTRLTGAPPAPDRVACVRAAAEERGAVVLLKGSTTIVAEPGGVALLTASGSPRLATAGTGDVLAGVIAAFIASGLPPATAAAHAAHAHGAAALLGPRRGLLAGDLVDLLPAWLSSRG